MKLGLLVFGSAFLLGAFTAHAATITTPTSGQDGHFTITTDTTFNALIAPAVGDVGTSTFCTASSTPLDYDCDISGTNNFGTWTVIAGTSTTETAIYDYQTSTTTAATLWGATVDKFGAVISDSWPIVEGVGAVLLAFFCMLLLIYGISRGVDRGTRGRLR